MICDDDGHIIEENEIPIELVQRNDILKVTIVIEEKKKKNILSLT